MRFGWSFYDSPTFEAIRKVRSAIQKAILNLKHNGVKSLLDHHLHELKPTTADQLRLLPELELRIGNDLTVKHKFVQRTLTRPRATGRRCNLSIDRVAK